MRFINIPGINGLGHTSSAKDFAHLLVPEIQKIQLNSGNLEEQKEQIYQETKKLLDQPLFIIGGDHSISYPIGKAFFQEYKNPGLIVFDAHADCMPPLTEPTHEEWLSALIQETNIPTLIIGLRKIESQEKDFLKSKNVTIITPEQVSSNSYKIIKEFCQNKNIYISFDIDALDPSIAPATHYTEPNGLQLQQVKELIEEIPKSQIKLIDLVEIHTNHEKQALKTTIQTAKQLINYLSL